VVSFTPRPIYFKGKSPWYPLDKRLSRSQSRSGRDGEEKNSQPLTEFESTIIQKVAQLYTITELSGLLRWGDGGKKLHMRDFIICTLHEIPLG
jgi:hypothetical protein